MNDGNGRTVGSVGMNESPIAFTLLNRSISRKALRYAFLNEYRGTCTLMHS